MPDELSLEPQQDEEEPVIPGLQEAAERSQPEKVSAKRRWLSVLNTVLNLVIIFAVVLAIRSYVMAPFQVSGASMTDTLEDKEYIIVNKLVYENLFGLQLGALQRGDIVVLEPPITKKTYYIKRVIGLPGETLKLDGNKVTIINSENPQGFVLEEDYLKCAEHTGDKLINNCDYSNLAQKEFTVPDNEYFVMGDNRMNSTDSRVCFGTCNVLNATPFVKKDSIIGKTWFVIWPLNHLRVMAEGSY